jgi:hypothetical protein
VFLNWSPVARQQEWRKCGEKEALYLAQGYRGLSNKATGDFFGGIHYSTTSKASGTSGEEMNSNQRLSKRVDEIDSHSKS